MAHASCFANFSVLVQVNEHMIDMFCNWWFHYQLLKIHNPVYVVAHGADVVATLVNDYRLAPERILSPPRMAAAGAGALAGSVRNFGSASFYALNTAKIRAAGDLMARTGRSVVFSDLDTVWLRSPLEQLERLPPEKAFAIGPEGSPLDFNHAASTTLAPRAPSPPPPAQARKYYVCACFFAACPSGAARAIFDTWWTASGRETGRGNEQEGFEWLLNLWPELVSGTASAGRGAARAALLKSKRIPRGIAELLAAGDGWLEDLLRNSSDGLHLDGGARENDARRYEGSVGLLRASGGPVAILPHAAFPTGRHDPPITSQSVWIHANWIQRKTRAATTVAKRGRLAKHGMWRHNCTDIARHHLQTGAAQLVRVNN